MKKVFAVLLAVLMIFSFAACDNNGGSSVPEVRLTESTAFLGHEDVIFANVPATVLTKTGDYSYELSGSLAPMSTEQATVWGGDPVTAAGDSFVVLTFPVPRGTASCISGWVATGDATLSDSSYDYKEQFSDVEVSADDGYWCLVAATTHSGGTTREDLVENPVLKVAITVDETTTTYTVDFTKVISLLGGTGSREDYDAAGSGIEPKVLSDRGGNACDRGHRHVAGREPRLHSSGATFL